jgi:hypothetical protein
MALEFNGKVGEQSAVEQYKKLAANFPQHPLAAQATGAANRLTSDGKPFTYVGCVDMSNNQLFGQAGVAGKVVIVYFWGSFSAQNGGLIADAKALADIAKKHAGKLEIITVCLDLAPAQALQAIKAASLPGTHLTSPNGQMATAWGIMGQHMFVVDKTGNVANNNASIPMISDEVEKLVK